MPNDGPKPTAPNRILVKLRPSNALRAAESRANLRPLYESRSAAIGAFGLDSTPQWFVADLPEGASTPWDLAHAQVAGQLGVAESDVVFAEPDLVHDIYRDGNEDEMRNALAAAGTNCTQIDQDPTRGKATGPGFAWHLGNPFTQLDSARSAVTFSERRTRIAHVDTGYDRNQAVKPAHILTNLERNFVEGENPNSAQDPNNGGLLLDNSGHGTGTLSILAGGLVPSANIILGGAPEADILPLRVASSVVLLRTSALARALDYAIQQQVDVITMSMGGLPSQAWAEAVDRLYEAGICYCAASGNHTGSLPPRVVVYPARYPRVIAVCGVMADGRPYDGLTGGALQGSFGPDAAMAKAIAAFTPNIPWALFLCGNAVRLNGEGTSAATPQVAAAAALWIEKYKNVLPRDFRRVEAVRKALFSKAKSTDRTHFGHGILQANDALAVAPDLTLPRSEVSKNSFAFLRLITGLGLVDAPPREEMFNLELTQRWMMNDQLQQLVPDPDQLATLQGEQLRKFMEAVIEDESASLALRKHVASRYPVVTGNTALPKPTKITKAVIPSVLPACDSQPALRNPAYRRLRVYAVDPSLSTRLDTAGINEVTLNVRWEKLEPGPVGEYLAVEDRDPVPTDYAPVDLNDPRLLAQDGWAPSEGNPQFHQQMVYAVAMKTIEHFERALGRPVLWRHGPSPDPQNEFDDSVFVRRLPIQPHALRQANAFYSPSLIALLFGYFEAPADDPGELMPGSRIYSCLSHDIVAHETTHAILDGMHRRFNEPTNIDVLAFHEGFADIVALLQHFSISQVLESEIARTRGDVEAESMLGMLAVQFGRATGSRGALRNAIGSFENGQWKRFVPDPGDLQKRQTPHSRGAVLVAAVFDAFVAIYKARTADLLRIYTGGRGVLPSGAIHPDLVRRLADEASKSASHVLTMCIRALDYLPPVDVTFFEYLRALITADYDLVRDDQLNYRVAFVEAFRRRGIYPLNVGDPGSDAPRTLSVDTLRWQGLEVTTTDNAMKQRYGKIVNALKRYADATLYLSDRGKLFKVTRERRRALHKQLVGLFGGSPGFEKEFGLDLSLSLQFEVHELRRSMRASPDGRFIPQIVVALTQTIDVPAAGDGTPAHKFRGGSTLIVDLSEPAVKYRVTKNIRSTSGEREARTAAFLRHAAADPLRALFFTAGRPEPFAALHALTDDVS
jgi:subtilisin family serine protease